MVPHPRRPAPPTWARAATPLPNGPHRLLAYRVVGDLPTPPYQLLLAGTDGRAYVFDLVSGAIVPLADAAGWAGTGPPAPTGN